MSRESEISMRPLAAPDKDVFFVADRPTNLFFLERLAPFPQRVFRIGYEKNIIKLDSLLALQPQAARAY